MDSLPHRFRRVKQVVPLAIAIQPHVHGHNNSSSSTTTRSPTTPPTLTLLLLLLLLLETLVLENPLTPLQIANKCRFWGVCVWISIAACCLMMAARTRMAAALVVVVVASLLVTPVQTARAEAAGQATKDGHVEKPERPNILHLVADDMRPELGCYGSTHMITPNLDQLAATGLRFQFAYTQFSYCAPSRNSFMSGRRPDRTRALNFLTTFRDAPGGEHVSWFC